ncbi:MAG: hypothetical protein OSJ27_01845 [Candidatus Gastranaerophilales bacterium]|nr:hypothetical protein [Candidatus Gastranaerophilales bacterium]
MRCDWNTGGCPGSYYTNCYPYELWTGTSGSGGYYRGYLNNGTFNTSDVINQLAAYGVRCVSGFGFLETKEISGIRIVKKIALCLFDKYAKNLLIP